VIHRQNHWTGLDHSFPVQDAESKKNSRQQPRQMVTQPVIEIHDRGWTGFAPAGQPIL
jgi:hypothetical protein